MLSIDDFSKKVSDIGEGLGYAIAFDFGINYRRVANLHGVGDCRMEKIRISQNEEYDRIFIKGVYPERVNGKPLYGVKIHKTEVSEHKSGECIAKEIKRRLLPAYREDLGIVVDFISGEKERAESRRDMAKEAANILGTDEIQFENGSEMNEAAIYYKGLKIECGEPDSMELRIGCVTLEQLRGIYLVMFPEGDKDEIT